MVTMKPRADAFHALAVYAESLADGRRVIVFGDPMEGLEERLVDLGARSVSRIAPADDASPLRNRAFELALVTGPTSFGDPAALLSRVRRVLTEDGVAVIAGVGLDYYRLFDLAAAEFEDVRMVGLLSFEGVALVELGGEESPAVSVDTQLTEPDRSPEMFVAVASRRRPTIEPYAIIELPASRPQEPRQDEALVAALAQERLNAHALEAQLQDAVRRSQAVDDLKAALDQHGLRVVELEAALEEERAEAEDGRVAAAQLEETGNQLEQARQLAAATQAEMARTGQAHVVELARFEETLRERAQNIRSLEVEVTRRDRMVRELVDSLETLSPVHPPEERSSDPTPLTDELARENSILRWRLDALALELARRDAEMQAGEWSIQELEHELAREEPAASPTQGEAQRLAAALEELEALRLALTQEHQARVRAESGEELVRARSEIQRQAALVEQLGRELQATRPPREELR
jgi:hypothetical protein